MANPGDYPQKISQQLCVLGIDEINLYLLVGTRRSALIEAGVSAIADRVIDQLNSLQVKPDYLLVTHPHTDHLTGIEPLRQAFPHAEIIIGAGTFEFLEHPKAEEMMVNEDRYISNRLNQLGFQPGFPPLRRLPMIPSPIVVDDPVTVDLGDLSLELSLTNGHSPGHVLASAPELDAVFPSDALGFYFPDRFVLPLFFTDWRAYVHGIQQIINLSPAFIGLGHQGPILGNVAARLLNDARLAAFQVRDQIIENERADFEVSRELYETYYRDEFTLYSPENIKGCMDLLVRRARQP